VVLPKGLCLLAKELEKGVLKGFTQLLPLAIALPAQIIPKSHRR
jgi:hypothetical protein